MEFVPCFGHLFSLNDAVSTNACGADAVIPPRKNARSWKPSSTVAVARNEAVNASRHLERAIWRSWSGHQRWSRVETKIHCSKLLAQSLMWRDFDRQVAETQPKLRCSIATPLLAYPATEAIGLVRLRKGQAPPATIYPAKPGPMLTTFTARRAAAFEKPSMLRSRAAPTHCA